MSKSSVALAQTTAEDFANYLHDKRRDTMDYALEHAQMEAWVALEGLHFFAEAPGWKSWETVAYVTSAPVRVKAGREFGIKFPDLVCWNKKIVLWWEFKAVGRRALHVKNAGGTLAKDVRALANFTRTKTVKYLNDGTLPGVRDRNDKNAIAASRLTGEIIRTREHIGVVVLLAPPEDEVTAVNPGKDNRKDRKANKWSPQEIVTKLDSRVREIPGVIAAVSTSPLWTPEGLRAPESKVSTIEHRPARINGWLVEMEGS